MQKLLTREQVQEILGVGKDWLRKRVERNEIICISLGHYVRFDPSDIRAFIVKCKNKEDSLTLESEGKRMLRGRKPREDLWQK